MTTQDITSLAIGYVIICLGIFLFGVQTACQDTAIMRNSGEPDYPSPFSKENLAIFGCMFLAAFCPLVNVMMFINTILYRKGLL